MCALKSECDSSGSAAGWGNKFVNRQWIDFPTGSSAVITRFNQLSSVDWICVCICAFSFCRVTCGLWESPPLRWQRARPVSSFLGKICCGLLLWVLRAPARATLALLLLHWARHGSDVVYLESRGILNQPGICWFQSSVWICVLLRKRKANFGGSFFLTHLLCGSFLRPSASCRIWSNHRQCQLPCTELQSWIPGCSFQKYLNSEAASLLRILVFKISLPL